MTADVGGFIAFVFRRSDPKGKERPEMDRSPQKLNSRSGRHPPRRRSPTLL
jgi:hypothetical protein